MVRSEAVPSQAANDPVFEGQEGSWGQHFLPCLQSEQSHGATRGSQSFYFYFFVEKLYSPILLPRSQTKSLQMI